MLKVGITGGIGSGKTTICKLFELLGVPVYYADDASKKLLVSDSGIRDKILAVFGEEVLDDNKLISRKKIALRVFNNEMELKKLNSIMHPAVAFHFDLWIKQQNAFPYIIKEAAILFESGAYLQMDKVVSVTAPDDMRIARVVKRDAASKDDIQRRMDAQISEAERIKRAQFVIVNDEQELVIPQVLKLHQIFSISSTI